ncbi:hypothetical protein MA786_004722 [Vibrio parahaemolyticus]|nr:hypothetical protein [Vibrio parahaemolyticus]EHZ2493323.1 hypothetical protein [Vibrio parahaemolyticus]EIV8641838.1 hypothetical protein [Vibrio parahaemolyticus]EIY6411608.1 hypothetical protein [Vibrio parahaemolyticus]EJB1765562.1 hypothetical protein [Vibrio parahaemolyticus]
MSLKLSDVIAFFALGVSGFSLLQSNDLTNQQIEMSRLNFTPAVSIGERHTLPIDSESLDVTTNILWEIENTGLGPALVYEAVAKIGDDTFPMSSQDAWYAMTDHLEKIMGKKVYGYNTQPVSCSYSIKDGANWSLFDISFKGSVAEDKLSDNTIHLGICYCSLNGDCYYEGTQEGLLTCPKEMDPATLIQGKGCETSA